MELAVVPVGSDADERRVGEARVAALAEGLRVVCLAPLRRLVAAHGDAAAVALDGGEPEARRHGALGAAHVEWQPVGSEDQAREQRVAGPALHGRGGKRLAVDVLRDVGAGHAGELREGHEHEQVRPHTVRRREVPAVQRQPREVDEGVGVALGGAAGVARGVTGAALGFQGRVHELAALGVEQSGGVPHAAQGLDEAEPALVALPLRGLLGWQGR